MSTVAPLADNRDALRNEGGFVFFVVVMLEGCQRFGWIFSFLLIFSSSGKHLHDIKNFLCVGFFAHRF